MVGRSGYFRPMLENRSNLQYEYLKNVLIMSVRINRYTVKYRPSWRYFCILLLIPTFDLNKPIMLKQPIIYDRLVVIEWLGKWIFTLVLR